MFHPKVGEELGLKIEAKTEDKDQKTESTKPMTEVKGSPVMIVKENSRITAGQESNQ